MPRVPAQHVQTIGGWSSCMVNPITCLVSVSHESMIERTMAAGTIIFNAGASHSSCMAGHEAAGAYLSIQALS